MEGGGGKKERKKKRKEGRIDQASSEEFIITKTQTENSRTPRRWEKPHPCPQACLFPKPSSTGEPGTGDRRGEYKAGKLERQDQSPWHRDALGWRRGWEKAGGGAGEGTPCGDRRASGLNEMPLKGSGANGQDLSLHFTHSSRQQHSRRQRPSLSYPGFSILLTC